MSIHLACNIFHEQRLRPKESMEFSSPWARPRMRGSVLLHGRLHGGEASFPWTHPRRRVFFPCVPRSRSKVSLCFKLLFLYFKLFLLLVDLLMFRIIFYFFLPLIYI